MYLPSLLLDVIIFTSNVYHYPPPPPLPTCPPPVSPFYLPSPTHLTPTPIPSPLYYIFWLRYTWHHKIHCSYNTEVNTQWRGKFNIPGGNINYYAMTSFQCINYVYNIPLRGCIYKIPKCTLYQYISSITILYIYFLQAIKNPCNRANQ